MTVARPVLRYHGGKFRLAPWIISFFPKHACYVEAFGGAGSILMLKTPVGAECYNDLDGRVVNLFRVLRDPAKALELQRRVMLTPFARQEFEWSYGQPEDDIDDAHRLVVLSFMGHGSDSATRSCRTGFRAKLTDGRALPSVEWAKWPNAIPDFTNRLAGVVIEQRNAVEVIQRMDAPGTLFFVDPPYLHSTRSAITGRSSGTHGYRHEMTDDDHRALAAVLHQVRGMVVLSGYPSDLYDLDLYPDWSRHERKHVADGGRARVEVVWLNQACQEALDNERMQRRLFA